MRDIRPCCYLIRRFSQLEKGEKRNSDEGAKGAKELGRLEGTSGAACTVGHDSIQGTEGAQNHTRHQTWPALRLMHLMAQPVKGSFNEEMTENPHSFKQDAVSKGGLTDKP